MPLEVGVEQPWEIVSLGVARVEEFLILMWLNDALCCQTDFESLGEATYLYAFYYTAS